VSQKLINVSNRLPIKKEGNTYKKSSGGLVAAMSGVRDLLDFVWVGWTEASADSAEEKQKIKSDIAEQFNYRPVFLEESEINDYYHGVCNSSLWPLLHYMATYADYNENWFPAYKTANQKFAEAVLEVAEENDMVWVHDYHLFLVPAILKAAMPSLKIGFFLHTPFPSYEIFRCHPMRQALIEGLLGADLIGFHTFGYLRHFRSTILRIAGIESEINNFTWNGQKKQIGVFPIGINWTGFEKILQSDAHGNELAKYRKQFKNKKVVLSVERLDYSKGIPRKLQAIEEFLITHPEEINNTVFMFISVPSRESVDTYRELKEEIEYTVGRINGQYSTLQNVPIHFLNQSVSQNELCALYSLADVCLVTPLMDGMNLVAKEYVACQTSGKGVLILSEFAGAAQELFNAILINPYNITEVAQAIHRALNMSEDEKDGRVEPMRSRVIEYNSVFWADSFIEALRESGSADSYTPQIVKKPGRDIIKQFRANNKRKALFLDYDGTLIEFERKPDAAIPTAELKSILHALSRREDISTHIVSGRKAEFLEKHLGNYNFTLIAEHGYMIKEPGKEWRLLNPAVDLSWKKQVKEVLELFLLSTPGTSIEEKTSALVWHYRKADPEFGLWKAHELLEHLTGIIANMPVEAHHGKMIIEVNSQLINKGSAVERIMHGNNFDMVLCIGDDQTDETMFRLKDKGVITVKVGKEDTEAKYRLPAPIQVREFLKGIIEAN